METLEGTRRVCLAAMFWSLTVLLGCSAELEELNFFLKQRSIESMSGVFSPGYILDPNNRHLVVYLQLENGVLVSADRPADVGRGHMPYRPYKGGEVTIVYRASDGTKLGQYGTLDPTVIRSHDAAHSKPHNLASKEMQKVEILLPFDKSISRIDIIRSDGTKRSFDVGKQIKSALQESSLGHGQLP